MKTFVVYDARRELAFFRFPHDVSVPVESGYLDTGLWVEFGQGDPVQIFVVAVEHPFFARSADFVDRVTALVGHTAIRKLRDWHLRHEAASGEVSIDALELEALMPAWQHARGDLRDRGRHADPRTKADRHPEPERQWLVPIRLEPVVARTVRQPTEERNAFDGRVEFPADLADALRLEPIVRIDVADGVMRLRGRVRDNESPPAGATLTVAGADRDVALSYDPDLGELRAEMALTEQLSTARDGDVVSLLTLRIRQERTG